MTDIFNSGYAPLHMLNVFAHVAFGTLAILLGFLHSLDNTEDKTSTNRTGHLPKEDKKLDTRRETSYVGKRS